MTFIHHCYDNFQGSYKTILKLLFYMILVVAIFRPIKLLEIKSVEAAQLPELKEQLEEVKKEKEELQTEVSSDLKGKIIKEIKLVFKDKAPEAIKIISCENNPDKPDYDPYRININKNASSLDYGVFQVNSLWEKVYGSEFKKNWKENIKVAKKIFDRSKSWQHWYSSTDCHKLASK